MSDDSQHMVTAYDLHRAIREDVDISLPDIALRDAIPAYRRRWGMIVSIYDDPDTEKNGNYKLLRNKFSTDLRDNQNWHHLPFDIIEKSSNNLKILGGIQATDLEGTGERVVKVDEDGKQFAGNIDQSKWEIVETTSGFRIPTKSEWEAEVATWGTEDSAGAFASPLKLSMAGRRDESDGTLEDVGSFGRYWSSTVDGTYAGYLYFGSSNAGMSSHNRANGYSVRLIKDEVYTGDAIDFVSEEIIIDGLTYNTVLNPNTNRIWLDRNLGATQVATSSTDTDSYGDLYQWGRATDGHEKRTSGTTTTLSSTDQPGHGDFILAPNSPNDWRDPQNDLLWQGVGGINNPAPILEELEPINKDYTVDSKWIKDLFDEFKTLTIDSSQSTWDTTTGLNKKITASANFTLNITNIENGMSGALSIEITTNTITITLSTGKTNLGNSPLSSLVPGNYVFAFMYDGNNLFYNVDSYA